MYLRITVRRRAYLPTHVFFFSSSPRQATGSPDAGAPLAPSCSAPPAKAATKEGGPADVHPLWPGLQRSSGRADVRPSPPDGLVPGEVQNPISTFCFVEDPFLISLSSNFPTPFFERSRCSAVALSSGLPSKHRAPPRWALLPALVSPLCRESSREFAREVRRCQTTMTELSTQALPPRSLLSTTRPTRTFSARPQTLQLTSSRP